MYFAIMFTCHLPFLCICIVNTALFIVKWNYSILAYYVLEYAVPACALSMGDYSKTAAVIYHDPKGGHVS